MSSTEQPDREGTLFPVRKAWWYLERDLLGSNQKASQGDAYFTADNPPFGAVFSYYLRETYETKTSERQKAEKDWQSRTKTSLFRVGKRLKRRNIRIVPKSGSTSMTIREISSAASKALQRKDFTGFPGTSSCLLLWHCDKPFRNGNPRCQWWLRANTLPP
jgi:hypothetical protein